MGIGSLHALCKLSLDAYLCFVAHCMAAIHASQEQPTGATVCVAVLIFVWDTFLVAQSEYCKCAIMAGAL